MPEKADILARLQRDILLLQGSKPAALGPANTGGLGHMNQSFPNGVFPFAGVHEFFCNSSEEVAASTGFLSGLLSSFLPGGGAVLWVGAGRRIFPPALKAFGLRPEQFIFLNLAREKEVPWAVEEALKCTSLSAVVGEMQELDFTASRRFQLCIETSGVGCFLLRCKPRNRTTASVTRWQVKPQPSRLEEGLPGLGHPRWQVSLLKVRNGRPGSWDLEWINGRFRPVSPLAIVHQALQKKTG